MDYSFLEKIWGDKAYHVPNITDLFGYNSLDRLNTYKERILSILPPRHKLILPHHRKEQTLLQLEYLHQIGFSFPQADNIIFLPQNLPETNLSDLLLKHLANISDFNKPNQLNFVPYIISEKFEKFLSFLELKPSYTPELSRKMNNKIYFRQWVKNLNLDINLPESSFVFTEKGDLYKQAEKACQKLINNGYNKFVLIKPESYSGKGIFPFNNKTQLKNLLATYQESQLIIDPWYEDIIQNSSCQLFIGDDKQESKIISMTDQFIDNCIHCGNIFPSTYFNEKLISKIHALMSKFHKIGIRGLIGIDFGIRFCNGKNRPFLLEANVRQTAAMYAALLSNVLYSKQKPWLLYNIKTTQFNSIMTFYKYLKNKKMDYSLGKQYGVFILQHAPEKNQFIVVILGKNIHHMMNLLRILI